jgi:hypothetical protein
MSAPSDARSHGSGERPAPGPRALSPRGPVTGALAALLTGPPTHDPSIADSVLGELWHSRDARRPWWQVDPDVALALIHLAELRRHGLVGVDDGWREHPVAAAAERSLGAPVRFGLASLRRPEPPATVSGCAVARTILATSTRRAGTAPSPAPASSLELRVEVAATRHVAERELAAHLVGTDAAEPESAAEILDLLGLGRSGDLRRLPGSALWQLAILGWLSGDPDLRPAALGWLTASRSAVSADHLLSGDALRRHGVSRAAAHAWDCYLVDPSPWVLAAAVESAVDTDPTIAAEVLAGADAAIAAMDAVEHDLGALPHEEVRSTV